MVSERFKSITVGRTQPGSSDLSMSVGQGVGRTDVNQGQVNPQGPGPSGLCLPDRPHRLQVLQPSKSCYKLKAKHS